MAKDTPNARRDTTSSRNRNSTPSRTRSVTPQGGVRKRFAKVRDAAQPEEWGLGNTGKPGRQILVGFNKPLRTHTSRFSLEQKRILVAGMIRVAIMERVIKDSILQEYIKLTKSNYKEPTEFLSALHEPILEAYFHTIIAAAFFEHGLLKTNNALTYEGCQVYEALTGIPIVDTRILTSTGPKTAKTDNVETVILITGPILTSIMIHIWSVYFMYNRALLEPKAKSLTLEGAQKLVSYYGNRLAGDVSTRTKKDKVFNTIISLVPLGFASLPQLNIVGIIYPDIVSTWNQIKSFLASSKDLQYLETITDLGKSTNLSTTVGVSRFVASFYYTSVHYLNNDAFNHERLKQLWTDAFGTQAFEKSATPTDHIFDQMDGVENKYQSCQYSNTGMFNRLQWIDLIVQISQGKYIKAYDIISLLGDTKLAAYNLTEEISQIYSGEYPMTTVVIKLKDLVKLASKKFYTSEDQITRIDSSLPPVHTTHASDVLLAEMQQIKMEFITQQGMYPISVNFEGLLGDAKIIQFWKSVYSKQYESLEERGLALNTRMPEQHPLALQQAALPPPVDITADLEQNGQVEADQQGQDETGDEELINLKIRELYVNFKHDLNPSSVDPVEILDYVEIVEFKLGNIRDDIAGRGAQPIKDVYADILKGRMKLFRIYRTSIHDVMAGFTNEMYTDSTVSALDALLCRLNTVWKRDKHKILRLVDEVIGPGTENVILTRHINGFDEKLVRLDDELEAISNVVERNNAAKQEAMRNDYLAENQFDDEGLEMAGEIVEGGMGNVGHQDVNEQDTDSDSGTHSSQRDTEDFREFVAEENERLLRNPAGHHLLGNANVPDLRAEIQQLNQVYQRNQELDDQAAVLQQQIQLFQQAQYGMPPLALIEDIDQFQMINNQIQLQNFQMNNPMDMNWGLEHENIQQFQQYPARVNYLAR